MERFFRSALMALLVAMLMAACGGGGNSNSNSSSNSSNTSSTQPTASVSEEPNAPQATGDTATDGLNWFNFRRQQAGVQILTREPKADAAAQGHSDYQKANNIITHEQTAGRPGFTGLTVGDRLIAAGYQSSSIYAYGEVISAMSSTSGFNAAEELIAAIYHRFVILDPVFRYAGSGAATVPGGPTYFTTNFVTDRLDTGLGAGRIIVYPFADQLNVPRSVLSDNEVPDTMPGRTEIGYPISVHADITSTLTVHEFTIRPRGGDPLAVQLLRHETDTHTRSSVAAIVPINVLNAATTYDVQFTGTVDGEIVTRAWSFTTR